MSYIPGILNTRHGSALSRCWLAGILGERMFRRKVDEYQIAKYDVAEYCKEIILFINDERANYRRQFRLHLYSHLMFGVVKLYSYQYILFEKSVLVAMEKLDLVEIGIFEKSTERKEKTRGTRPITFSQTPIDELLMPLTPNLNLSRPFGCDMNLLHEVSPASHRRLRELEESHQVPLSPLTATQVDLWVSNDERGLWPGVDTSLLPALERSTVAAAAQHDSPTVTVRTPTKRASTGKNRDTPSKRQRTSRVPQIATMDEERAEPEGSAVLPMEQDDEQLAISVPVEPMVIEAPDDLLVPVDFIAEVDSVPAVVPMEQHGELHRLPEQQVVTPPPEDSVALAHAIDQLDIDSIPAEAVQPVEASRRSKYRRRTFKAIDVIKSISVVQLKQRQRNVRAYTVPEQTTDAIPTKRLVTVRTMIRLPSTIFNFGVESIPHNRLRTISDELLRRYEINISDPFVVETDNLSTIRTRDSTQRRSHVPPSVLGDGADATKLNENGTVIEPNDTNGAPPVEAPQSEAPDEPAFDTTTRAELPFGNIDNPAASVNTSEAITVSIGRVHISADSPDSKAAENRRNLSSPAGAIHSPQSKDRVTVEKSARSKTPSSNECITEVTENESSSSRIAAASVWTRKDLEACLEVHWHDNNVINFEQLAPPNETSDADASACFMLLLDMYKENKIVLTQAGTYAPIYIERGVPSDAMDWS